MHGVKNNKLDVPRNYPHVVCHIFIVTKHNKLAHNNFIYLHGESSSRKAPFSVGPPLFLRAPSVLVVSGSARDQHVWQTGDSWLRSSRAPLLFQARSLLTVWHVAPRRTHARTHAPCPAGQDGESCGSNELLVQTESDMASAFCWIRKHSVFAAHQFV